MIKNSFIILCIIGFSSCSKSVPFGIIEPEKMEKLLWEQMKADAYTREYLFKEGNLKVVEENIKLQQKIFLKYNTSQKSFYKSYQYYLEHPDLIRPLLDSIVSKQTLQKQKDFEQRMKSIRPYDWQRIFKVLSPDANTTKPYKLNGIIIVKDTTEKKVEKKENVLDSLKFKPLSKRKINTTTYNPTLEE